MPFVFTSWTACADPAGNARTLDWSEAGMRGQFAGLYLEALRQAANLRNGVVPETPAPFGPALTDVAPQPALVHLAHLAYWIDDLAWDKAPTAGFSVGWVLTSGLEDDPPAIWTDLSGDAPMLAEIGDAARVYLGDNEYQFPPVIGYVRNPLGPWLRQVQKVFKAKTRVRTGTAPGPYTVTDYAGVWALGA